MPQSRILITHVKSDRLSRPFLFSAVGHLVLFLGGTFVTDLFPPVEIVSGSTGVGGGQGGNLVSVGLAADLGGGAGMYKPAVTPRVQAAPPPPAKRKQEVTPKAAPDQVEFQQKTSRKRRPRKKKPAAVPIPHRLQGLAIQGPGPGPPESGRRQRRNRWRPHRVRRRIRRRSGSSSRKRHRTGGAALLVCTPGRATCRAELAPVLVG